MAVRKILVLGSSQARRPEDWTPIAGCDFDFRHSYPGATTAQLVRHFQKEVACDASSYDAVWVLAGSNDSVLDVEGSTALLQHVLDRCETGENEGGPTSMCLVHNVFGAAGNTQKKFRLDDVPIEAKDGRRILCLTPQVEGRRRPPKKWRRPHTDGVPSQLVEYGLGPTHVDASRHLLRAGIEELLRITESSGLFVRPNGT